MSFSWTRVRAISVKELRDYRRNRFVIGTMTVMPLLAILALISLNVITVSTALAIALAAALLAVDLLAWRIVAAMFDRERLVTGSHG